MDLFEVYTLYNITPVSGKGVHIVDDQGEKNLDLNGGHAVISIGHSHPHFINAIKSQLNELAFYSNSVKNPLQLQLAQKLERLSGCSDYQRLHHDDLTSSCSGRSSQHPDIIRSRG